MFVMFINLLILLALVVIFITEDIDEKWANLKIGIILIYGSLKHQVNEEWVVWLFWTGTVMLSCEIMWQQNQTDIVTNEFSRDWLMNSQEVVYEMILSIQAFKHPYLMKSYNVQLRRITI